ncbi:MFS transporter [Armatimonas sp.]|uniref:MFS transporter n=1 Tax=Armatimonas sp. TaxID=1872638 RepID=UPI00286C481A|nr:MFS transporter [Armatimonas sp.]
MAASRYKWLVVGMLWFICFFNYADRLAIFSVFPLLEKELGFSKTELGVIGAAFTWVYALTAPFAGHVGDKMPRKWVILGGLYVWSLVTGLTAHCTKVIHFVLVRGAEGLGETFYFPASMALISDYHSPKTRSRAIGLHQTSIYAGTIAGGALAGWMGEKYGWYSPFWVLAGAGIVLGLVLQRFIREPQRNQAEREERATVEVEDVEEVAQETLPIGQFLREFVRTKTAVLLIIAYFGANLVGLVFFTWMPTFLKEKFHLNLAVAGLGATLFIQLASMGGSVLGGVVADRWSQTNKAGRILVQAFAALVGAPFIVLCGWTRDPWMLILAMSCFGLCKGIYDSNLTAAFYDVINPSRRSTATGLMNLLGWLGAGLGSLVIGVAVDQGATMSAAISSTGLVYLGVAGFLFAAARTRLA